MKSVRSTVPCPVSSSLKNETWQPEDSSFTCVNLVKTMKHELVQFERNNHFVNLQTIFNGLKLGGNVPRIETRCWGHARFLFHQA